MTHFSVRSGPQSPRPSDAINDNSIETGIAHFSKQAKISKIEYGMATWEAEVNGLRRYNPKVIRKQQIFISMIMLYMKVQ